MKVLFEMHGVDYRKKLPEGWTVQDVLPYGFWVDAGYNVISSTPDIPEGGEYWICASSIKYIYREIGE